MNRIKALLAALFALLLTFGLAAPANAYITQPARISLAANTANPLHIDTAVIFYKQADGTGVQIEQTWIDVVTGCTAFFGGNNPRWWVTGVHIYDGNTGNYVQSAYNGNESTCDQTVWSNQYGYDEGYVKVVVDAGANLAGEADKWFRWEWNLYPSGNKVLVSAEWRYY